ncbi:MAG TPA: NAD(P)/FAD-dependent oxidoreductase [Candidatus Dormibacteraeota bacterium]|nr:NAD(P)/FAD-dependent oxidoreductase [Candidatus Dormibacteraeota bacterium]
MLTQSAHPVEHRDASAKGRRVGGFQLWRNGYGTVFFFLMDRAQILIIGGGVVGCAVARAVSARWQDVFLVEQFPKLGMATSTRNSGVIHSGIYYPKDSLKARHCIQGNRLTYEFCARYNVAHRRTGKLVVAMDAQEEAKLAELKTHGENNGVAGLRMIGPAEIRAREPHISGVAALDVTSTGIVSAEELVHAYARVAVAQGANIVTRARVTSLESVGETIRVGVRIGDAPASEKLQWWTADAQAYDAQCETIEARCVINAAGLFADEVAALLGNHAWRIYPVRGEYCEIRGPRAALINGLVYPLPHADGLSLGTHFTKTLWGSVLIGPTARYVEGKDNYERERLGVADFAQSAKKLLPELEESDLQLAYSGLRPKLVPPGRKGIADFVIARDALVEQAIHLVGIESPGLTAAPAIAEQVTELVAEILA